MSDARSAWWSHLAQVRWFGGKGAGGAISALDPLPDYTAPGAIPAVRSEIATIDYPDGRREFYHLLVATYPAGMAPVPPLFSDDGEDIVDATMDPGAVRAFVAAVQDHPGHFMHWSHQLPEASELEIDVYAGEQSNTTILLGRVALFKLFRRVEAGRNLEAETLTALDAASAATPALLGRLVGDWPGKDMTDLGIVVERVPEARDGWVLATAACASETDFSAEARELGSTLASVHAVLLDAFGPGIASGDELAQTMTRRLLNAVAVAPQLEPFVDALRATFDTLRGAMLPVQRIHGDFHLGQTLRGANGWAIIDFEGEPAKSATERRLPDSIWRDVAGMLRSFDYARSAHAHSDSDGPTSWAQSCREAFLEGYCGVGSRPIELLSAYEVDKAVYEIVYEQRNRPDWLGIPLKAVEQQATRAMLVAASKGTSE